jgi:hypothetical protein
MYMTVFFGFRLPFQFSTDLRDRMKYYTRMILMIIWLHCVLRFEGFTVMTMKIAVSRGCDTQWLL